MWFCIVENKYDTMKFNKYIIFNSNVENETKDI